MNTQRYANGPGLRLLEHLYSESRFVFSSQDARRAAVQLKLPATIVPRALGDMVQSGWIQRLRRDRYIGTPEFPGFAQVPPLAIATALVAPSAISLWSALSFHGLTDQLPHAVWVTTTKKVVTPSMRRFETGSNQRKHFWMIGGVEYRYTTVRPRFFFGWEFFWLDVRFRIPIFTKERTLLDLFAVPRVFGGVGLGLEILQRSVAEIQTSLLIDCALQYGVIAVSKRLGWALQVAGVSDRQTRRLREISAEGFSLLDPTSPPRGPFDKKWSLRLNLPARRP